MTDSTAPHLFTCPMCGTVHNGLHACTGHIPYYQATPLTAEDVRKIVREELERYRLPRRYDGNMGPG
jgi:hypothetical protein